MTSRALTSLDPEGEDGGCLVSPHRLRELGEGREACETLMGGRDPAALSKTLVEYMTGSSLTIDGGYVL